MALRVRRGRAWCAITAGFLLALLALPAAGRAVTIQTFPIPTAASGAAHIVAGPDGALWFTEQAAYQIGRITTSGQFTEIPVPNNAVGVSDAGPSAIASSGGSLWFATDLGETVYQLATSGGLTPRYHDQVNAVEELAPSDTGGVWLMLFNGGAIGRIDSDGTVTPFSATYANTLSAIAEAPDGSVWFNNEGLDLYRVTDAGASTTTPLPPPGPDQVSSIAFDRSGNPWFTEYAPASPTLGVVSPQVPGCCGQIGDLTGGAAHLTPIGPQVTGHGFGPHSITLGPDGQMYFAVAPANPFDADTFNGIGRVDPATGQVQLANISPYEADDIAFGSDGALWFVDDRDNLIGRVTLSDLFPPAGGNGGGGGTGSGGGGGGGANGGSGNGGSGNGTAKGKTAPAVTLKLPRLTIPALRRSGVAKLGCHLAGAGRCTVTATIQAKEARKLGLKPKKGVKTVTLSRGSALAKRAATVTVKLKFSKNSLRALGRARKPVKLTIAGRSTAPGAKPVTVERALTLRR